MSCGDKTAPSVAPVPEAAELDELPPDEDVDVLVSVALPKVAAFEGGVAVLSALFDATLLVEMALVERSGSSLPL